MKRRQLITMMSLLTLLIVAGIQPVGAQRVRVNATPEASPVVDGYECDQVAAYADESVRIFDEDGWYEIVDMFAETQFEAVRPSQFMEAADTLFAIADDLEAMNHVPEVAEPYHDALIDYLSIMGNFYLTISTDGHATTDSLYRDAITMQNAWLISTWEFGKAGCGSLWTIPDPSGAGS